MRLHNLRLEELYKNWEKLSYDIMYKHYWGRCSSFLLQFLPFSIDLKFSLFETLR